MNAVDRRKFLAAAGITFLQKEGKGGEGNTDFLSLKYQ
jgi:hypothetical protein